MSIVLVGLNHKTAPVEVREQFAFTDAACAEHLPKLVDGKTIREALILSTCNRVEVLAAIDGVSALQSAAHISDFLSSAQSVPRHLLNKHLYVHEEADAVRHVFRVAASLDSMVVGEPQILGQVKHAFSLAVNEGTIGRVLHRLLHTAFRVAKRVRTETGIGASAVSLSYAAVALARKSLGSLENRTVLLVGAGTMAELAARHLISAGANRILITNRTPERAYELAVQTGGEAVCYAHLAQHLSEADILICSTAADEHVITGEMAEAACAARGFAPTFYIDMSVPRNIDPQAAQIPNLHVYDTDDLGSAIAENLRVRTAEAERAQEIIESEVAEFQKHLRQLDFGPTVGALRGKLDQMAREEYERYRSRLGELSPEQEQAIEAMLNSVVNKISHPVIGRLRRSYDTGEAENVQVWREIFGLKEDR